MESKSAMRLVMAALAGIATIAGGSEARADTPPRVGVVAGVHVNVPDKDATAISRDLAQSLEKELLVETVAGEEAEAALQPEGVPDGCITQPDCLKTLNQRLGTDQVLVLVVLRVGERIRIESTWADQSGSPVDRPPINLNQGLENAGPIFADNAQRLLPDAKQRPRAATSNAEPNLGGGGGEVGTGGGTGAGGGVGAGTGGGGSGGGIGRIDRPRGRHMTGLAWTALAVGGGIWAATGVWGFVADHKRPDDQSRKDLNRKLDIIGGSALGLGVVTAGILYYLSDSDEPAQTATVEVGRGPGDVGVSVGGTF